MKCSLVLLIVSVIIASTFGDPHDLPEYAEKRYHLEPFFKTNWFKAMQYCHSKGMRLITIASKEEQRNIENFARESDLGDESFWTSGTSLGDQVFYWFDSGKKITFTNWINGEPNDFDSDRKCIEILNETDFKWNDCSCFDNNKRVICEENV
ncbi:C-type lectin 37Db-like [Contarinia nasturtii]|uniref:C-type lectin 37Db-like n=1 Tax=Contarinia nasturtii TaxID=265458 RepID=UPI0012D3E280|nr:C-type lectin 37Db-like [Contarinia nasturtii]